MNKMIMLLMLLGAIVARTTCVFSPSRDSADTISDLVETFSILFPYGHTKTKIDRIFTLSSCTVFHSYDNGKNFGNINTYPGPY